MNDVDLSVRTGTVRPAFVGGVLFAAVGDPEGTRTVTSIVALLVALGIALVMLAIWLFRSTRPDPELLAPLEVMGERKWRRGDPVWQRRRLDQIRPHGAAPLEPSIAPPDIDEAFDQGPSAAGFDDFHDVALAEPGSSEGDRSSPQPSETAAALGRSADLSDTPEAISRPEVDELPEGELDPEVLAAALAELDAELGHDQR
jgi:hypothetical protein